MVAKGKAFLVERDFSLNAVSWESPYSTASLNITTAQERGGRGGRGEGGGGREERSDEERKKKSPLQQGVHYLEHIPWG